MQAGGATIRCNAGHEVGRIHGDVIDMTAPRAGDEAALVAFWSTSPEYYELARAVNADYDAPDHESHRRLIAALAAGGVRRVLDVGCGTAEISAVLAERIPGVQYVGVEVSPLAVRTAQELGRPGVFLAADAERLPFPDGSFDAASSAC